MYAHRTIQPLDGLHVQIDLPPGVRGYGEAEIIMLPTKPMTIPAKTWESRVLRHAGVLGDDFLDDIDDSGLGVDAPRDSLD